MTKVKLLDTTLTEMSTAPQYNSSLWTLLQKSSIFLWEHQTVVPSHSSFCICDIALDVQKAWVDDMIMFGCGSGVLRGILFFPQSRHPSLYCGKRIMLGLHAGQLKSPSEPEKQLSFLTPLMYPTWCGEFCKDASRQKPSRPELNLWQSQVKYNHSSHSFPGRVESSTTVQTIGA